MVSDLVICMELHGSAVVVEWSKHRLPHLGTAVHASLPYLLKACTVKALYDISRVLYFAVFPMNVSSLKFNFADFEFATLLQHAAETLAWYLILRKQFVHEICKMNPT